MKRHLLAPICLLVILCLLCGCSKYPDGQTFTYGDLRITLPGDFMDLSGEGIDPDADFLYGRNTLVVKGMAEKKAALQEMTLEAYTALVIQGNDLSCEPSASGSGYLFTYAAPVADTMYTYTTATFEGADSFWILQFYCPSANIGENQPEIDIILEGIQPRMG